MEINNLIGTVLGVPKENEGSGWGEIPMLVNMWPMMEVKSLRQTV